MNQFLFLFPFFQHVDHFKTLLIHLMPHLMGPDPVESNVFPLTHNTPTLNCLINIAIELHFSHTSFFLFLHFCSLLSSTQRCWKSPWRRKPGVTMDLQEAEDWSTSSMTWICPRWMRTARCNLIHSYANTWTTTTGKFTCSYVMCTSKHGCTPVLFKVECSSF